MVGLTNSFSIHQETRVDISFLGNNGADGYGGQRSNRARHGNNQNYAQQQNNFYPNSTYQQSNDNFTAGSGSATDQWGNSTDPSSVNSSYDRLQQQQRYGQQQDPYSNNGAPPPPQHRMSFNQTAGGSGAVMNPALPAPKKRVMEDEKKKRGSWITRRFTKDNKI